MQNYGITDCVIIVSKETVTRTILLDIEGTTTPIDFVHKTLFPFARSRVATFVETHFDSLKPEIEQLVDESSKDQSYAAQFDPFEPQSVSAYLEHLIDVDRKSTPLKSIQGKIWKLGYESGELRSAVFDDVLPALERWNTDGKTIAIFSSGSMLAQRLLFQHTEHGDLTAYISNYFDTTIGDKRSRESYEKIAAELHAVPADILFVSDIVPELDAAAAAGLQVVLSVRVGNAEIDEPHKYRVIRTFDELAIQNTNDSVLRSPD